MYRHLSVYTCIILGTALMLGGCHHAAKTNKVKAPQNATTTLNTAKAKLQQTTPCCSTFADFSFQHALPWQPQKFELGPGSLVANLDNTHSYFLAFKLPTEVKLPYRVAFKSVLNGRWLSSSYLFAPTVVVLDEAFQPILTQDVPLCERMGWTSATSGAFGRLDVASPKARYLVVYSSAKQQAGTTYWEQSPTAFSADATVKVADTGSFRVPHGPDGTLWLGLVNQTYQDALNDAICEKPAAGDGVLHTLRDAVPAPSWFGGKSMDTSAANNVHGNNAPASASSSGKN